MAVMLASGATGALARAVPDVVAEAGDDVEFRSIEFPNGDTYRGDYVAEQRTGQGVYTWANGDRYEGQFLDGQMHGEGTFYWADGRIYSGEQALEAGLIDKFGNLTDAIMLAASLADLKEELPPVTYPAKEDFSLLRFLVGNGGSSLFEGKMDLHPFLSYEWSLSR